jgi:DNA-directed RNA polymerase specialized sigma24 family protein
MDRLAAQIEELYGERFGAFRSRAAAVTGGWDTGLDATQEGFARAYARRATYRGEGTLDG